MNASQKLKLMLYHDKVLCYNIFIDFKKAHERKDKTCQI